MTQRTKIAAAAVTSVLLLGAIDKRIDSDRVYQQARVAEAAAKAVSTTSTTTYTCPITDPNIDDDVAWDLCSSTPVTIPGVVVENQIPFASEVVGKKWFPMAGFAWFSIASGVQEEWIHD